MKSTIDIAIVGAGAAGLLCALAAAQANARVTVIEGNDRPGKKLRITGKGRCNVTNVAEGNFLDQVVRNPRFLYSALAAFSNRDTMALLELLGVPLKVERGGRVFPQSNDAADVVQALYLGCKALGVEFLWNARAVELLVEKGRAAGVRLQDNRTVQAKAVVLCTGGASYPTTGSRGEGQRMAAAVGQPTVALAPALSPIRLRESDLAAQLEGLSLRNVTLTLLDEKGKTAYTALGELVFTQDGISGPLALSAGSYMVEDPEAYTLRLNLKPGLTREQLDARLLRDFAAGSNKQFKSILPGLLPKKLHPVAAQLCGISDTLPLHQVTKAQRLQLLDWLQGFVLHPVALADWAQAIVTRGGVAVGQVRPKTLESKVLPGLYFAGEILDVDALTGGYNLQIAFSTGTLAGRAAAEAVAAAQ